MAHLLQSVSPNGRRNDDKNVLLNSAPGPLASMQTLGEASSSIRETSPDASSPTRHSLEDHFFTPRAGSPFFTPRSGSPFFPTHLASAQSSSTDTSTARETSVSSVISSRSSPEVAVSLVKALSPSLETSSPRHSMIDAADPDCGTANRLLSPPSFSSLNDGSEATDDSEASSFTEQGSLLTISPSRPNSVIGQKTSSSTSEMADQTTTLAAEESTLKGTGNEHLSMSLPPEAAPRIVDLPPLSSWPTQLHHSLVQEGLTETAATARQELHELQSKIIPRGESTAPQPFVEATAVEMAERQVSASSEISRTPSTSTTGSLAAQSSTSAETAPSSVLSELEGPIELPDHKLVAAESLGKTILPRDEQQTQSRIRRYHALLELVETEQSYARDLSVLVHVYMEFLPLQQFFEHQPARLEVVMRNAPELARLHAEVAADLEGILLEHDIAVGEATNFNDKAMSSGLDAAVAQVGQYFASMSSNFSRYQDFCARHSEALALIKEAEKRHNGEDFAAFERLCWNVLRSRPTSSRNSSTTDLSLRGSRSGSSTPGGASVATVSTISAATTSRPTGATTSLSPLTPVIPDVSTFDTVSSNSSQRGSGRLTFADLLIKPIQRLCLYPLVIHTLLKHTAPGEPGHEELQAALVTVRQAADDVDEASRNREHFLLAELVASRIEPNAVITHPLISSFGNVKLSGTLDVLYHHQHTTPLTAPLRFRFLGLFLYQQGLLVVKVRKSGGYEPCHWFPLSKAQLSSVEEDEGVLPHAFRLTVDGQHHFEMAASSSRERALWVEILASTIEVNSTGPSESASATPYPSSLYCSQMMPSTSTPASEVEQTDPLSQFLTQQSASATSSEVLVRYASLAQRAVVDKGMIFSEAVISARAITHKDGTFTPGGSITKSSANTTPGSTTPTPMTAAGLTAWPASNTTSSSSLGAAVGAAMGLARVAKRSNKQNASSNVFEVAAQQYLAAEEQRWAEESRLEQQQARNSIDAGSRSALESGRQFPSSSKTSLAANQRKRNSFVNRPSIRPLSTIVGFGSGVAQRSPTFMDGSDLVASPDSSTSPYFEHSGLLDYDIPRTSSPLNTSDSTLDQPNMRRRRSFLTGSSVSLRDSFAGSWSRRGRSQSANIQTSAAFKPPTMSQPASPTKSGFAPMDEFGNSARHPLAMTPATNSSQDANVRSRSTLRRALTGFAERRERSQSVCELSPSIQSSSGMIPRTQTNRNPGFEGSPHDSSPKTSQRTERRRTSSSFGNLMGPPIDSLRRSMSFTTKWTSPSRQSSPTRDSRGGGSTAAADRRSPVRKSFAVKNASQPLLVSADSSPRASAPSYADGGKVARSATDSRLVQANVSPAPRSLVPSRPTTPRVPTGPVTKLNQLGAELFGRSKTSSPSSRAHSRRSSAASTSDAVSPAFSELFPEGVEGSTTNAGYNSSSSPTSFGLRTSNPRRSNRLSAIFFGANPSSSGNAIGLSSTSHSRSNSGESNEAVALPKSFATSAVTRSSVMSGPVAFPSPLPEEVENPMNTLGLDHVVDSAERLQR